jgi:protein-S-isoprenylcysteine O-methyltransferase Ste14
MGLFSKLEHRRVDALRILAIWIFAVPLVWFARPSVPTFAAGLGLILVGLAIRSWAAGHLQRNQELATSGPYAYLRDPLYLGRLFLLCGFGVMGNSTITYAVFAFALLIFFLNYMPRKLKKESQRLEHIFGAQYSEYHQHVRSLVPRLRPYAKRSTKRWQARVFWNENREYWLILAVLLLVGLMAAKLWVKWP